MSNISIRSRLIGLVAFFALALASIGGIGFYIANSAEAEIESIFQHQTLPMRELARIRRLVVENSGQVFRALQHNPASDYAKLHEHPIGAHLEVIDKNLKWMDETFVSLRDHLLPDSEEAAILREFEPLYKKYTESVIQPMLKSIQAGDFSTANVARFLKENGDFEKQMNPLLRGMAEAQEKAVKASQLAASARNGRLEMLAVLTALAGLLLGLGIAIYTIRSISGPLASMQQLITRAARDHDFTGRIVVSGKDEVGITATAFNDLMGTLQQSLGELRQGMIRIDEATVTLASAADSAAGAANESSESASAMAASVEQMSVSITSVSDHTREALNIANTAGEYSETGGKVIGNSVSAMGDIAVQVRTVGTTITELGEHSQRISSVVQVIKEVADQTNLLALNAAIEAARAGEQGRGFAVVADEVRKLAERTTKATGEIAAMIGDIQSRSQSAVAAMENTIERLENGTRLAGEAGTAIEAIRGANGEVLRVFSDIDEAMREQGAASYDIAQRVERVAQASEQSSHSVRISADEASNIRQLANAMRSNVERYKV